MPARPPRRPLARPRDAAPVVDAPDGVGRAISDVAEAIRRVDARVSDRAAARVDLVVGANRIMHQLGRAPIGASVSPTTADAAFAWALGDRDDRIATINVVGVAQPGAGVEFW